MKPIPTSPPSTTLLTLIQVWGLGLLTLHLAAPHLPVESMWAFWPFTFLPLWLAWLSVLAVGALTLPLRWGQPSPQPSAPPRGRGADSRKEAGANLELNDPPPSRGGGSVELKKQFGQPQIILLALLSGLLFYLARLQHLRWGDGYFLTILLPHPDPAVRVIYNWQAPLTVLLHQRLWHYLADPLLGWSVTHVYAAVSITCGVAFVYLLLTLSRTLARDRTEFLIISGLVLTTGSMQLFFGYVENYTIISLGLLITVTLAWHSLQGDIQPFWPILAFSVTNGFHPSTVFLWPSLLFLAWMCYRRGYVTAFDGALQTIVTPLLIGGGVFAIMEMGGHGWQAFIGQDRPGGGDGIWFVPLFEVDPTNRWQRYTLFSPEHLIDWFNLHLLISPFGLLLLVSIGVMVYQRRATQTETAEVGFDTSYRVVNRRDSHQQKVTLFANQSERDYATFLSLMTAAYLLWTFLWHPDYGAQKDWDLFAPSAFVYTLLAAWLLTRALPHRATLRQAGLFAIAVSLLHTAAWVWTNMQPLSVD